eukprot:6186398-Pleurochrysis_carterae.AAC.2
MSMASARGKILMSELMHMKGNYLRKTSEMLSSKVDVCNSTQLLVVQVDVPEIRGRCPTGVIGARVEGAGGVVAAVVAAAAAAAAQLSVRVRRQRL